MFKAGIEAQRALTKCQKIGQGWPRQRAEGSLRRSEREANDVVGDSRLFAIAKKTVNSLHYGFFVFNGRAGKVHK